MRRGMSDRWGGAACLRPRMASWLASSEVKASYKHLSISLFRYHCGDHLHWCIIRVTCWLSAGCYAGTCSSCAVASAYVRALLNWQLGEGLHFSSLGHFAPPSSHTLRIEQRRRLYHGALQVCRLS